MARRAVDWERLKGLYVLGEMTLRELAAQEGVSAGAVMKHAAAENWLEERDRQRKAINRAAQRKAKRRAVDREARAIERVRKQIDQLLEATGRALSDPDQLFRVNVEREDGSQDQVVSPIIDSRAVRNLAQSMQVLSKTLAEMQALKRDPEGGQQVQIIVHTPDGQDLGG